MPGRRPSCAGARHPRQSWQRALLHRADPAAARSDGRCSRRDGVLAPRPRCRPAADGVQRARGTDQALAPRVSTLPNL
eukprot:359927-Chlamydomonas_euryale.AAC.2